MSSTTSKSRTAGVAYPHGVSEYIASGPLMIAANLLSAMAAEFARRPDLTDKERGAAMAAHTAMQYATGLAWCRDYDAGKSKVMP